MELATWSTPSGDVIPGVPAAPLRALLLAGSTTLQWCQHWWSAATVEAADVYNMSKHNFPG
jgi:hypothetical protein